MTLISISTSLGVPNFDILFFRRQSMFLFSVLTVKFQSELFASLISNYLYHEWSGNLRHSSEKACPVPISTYAVVPWWNFEWFHMTSDFNPLLIPLSHQQSPLMLNCEIFSTRWSITKKVTLWLVVEDRIGPVKPGFSSKRSCQYGKVSFGFPVPSNQRKLNIFFLKKYPLCDKEGCFH